MVGAKKTHTTFLTFASRISLLALLTFNTKEMKEDIFDEGKEPNETLKKAAEKYKQKVEYHPDSVYGQWMKRMNREK